MAFWKRSEAVRHGFESVRYTIEQNYDAIEAVFARYGLRMDPEAARRQATRARTSHGWEKGAATEASSEDRPLRLVADKRA